MSVEMEIIYTKSNDPLRGKSETEKDKSGLEEPQLNKKLQTVC